MVNVIIWGTGYQYNVLKNTISYFELTKQISVKALVTNHPTSLTIDGYSVITANKIMEYDYDLIIVMANNSYCEIVNEAINMYGIDRNKIVPYRILFVPNINLRKYVRLKNSNVTIVSNNCWGGVTYRTLGLRCISPFRNLFLLDEDYIKLITDFNYYLSLEPKAKYMSIDLNSKKEYPVLELKDIELHCNHSNNFTEAINEWNKRKGRINYANVFFEMYTENPQIHSKFIEVMSEKRGVCFVDWNVECENTIRLEVPEGKKLWEVVNASASLQSDGVMYNIVDLLLSE